MSNKMKENDESVTAFIENVENERKKQMPTDC